MGVRRGASAVEIMVAVMVAAALGIPMLTLLFQGRDTEQRSRFEYMASLASRDEMYQARVLVACGVDPNQVAHDFRALEGDPLEDLGSVFAGSKPDVQYHASQKRVQTRVEIRGRGPGSQRIHLGKVTAKWLDDAQAAKDERKTTVEMTFGVLRPPWSP